MKNDERKRSVRYGKRPEGKEPTEAEMWIFCILMGFVFGGMFLWYLMQN
jgi:hypothetical protein